MVRIVRGLREQRSPGRALLRRWLFLLACTLLGTLLTAIVLLARPPLYEAQATVRFDPQRYDFAVMEDQGQLDKSVLVRSAQDLLALANLGGAIPPDQPIDFRVAGAGALLALSRSSDAAQAVAGADRGATALAEAVQSIRGWDLLRTLLRRAIYLQGQGRPESPTPLTPHLFDLLDDGFLAYDPTIPVSPSPPVLSAQDVADIILAVERMRDRQTVQMNDLFGQLASAPDPASQAALRAELAAVVAKRERLGEMLMTLYKEEALYQVAGGAGPQVEPASQPEQPLGPAGWPFLLVGAAGGLVLGTLLALADEALELVGRLRELVEYGDLIWNLVLRDLKARYKSSILGYLWSLVNPLLLMIVFTVLFKFLLKSPIPNFAVFIIVGLLPWNFCASSVSGSVGSITGQGALIKKVYFPREAIPIALVSANLVNFILALPAMFLIMLLLNAHLQPVALLFPLIALIETIFLLGVAFFLSALNVFFRDTQVITEVLLMAWFFLTPIFYRLNDIVDERLGRLVRWLNPMASLVDFYRDIFYLGGMPGWDAIIRTLITALLVLAVGYIFFARLSPRFGEEI